MHLTETCLVTFPKADHVGSILCGEVQIVALICILADSDRQDVEIPPAFGRTSVYGLPAAAKALGTAHVQGGNLDLIGALSKLDLQIMLPVLGVFVSQFHAGRTVNGHPVDI